MPREYRPPLSVVIAALLLGGIALWRLGAAFSSWAFGPLFFVDILEDLFASAFWLYISWGLLNYQRWAWWLAVVFDGALAAFLIGAVAFFDYLRPHLSAGVDARSLVDVLIIAAAFAGGAWLLLMLPQSRRAFSR